MNFHRVFVGFFQILILIMVSENVSFSQERIHFSIERNFLKNSFLINDSTTFSSGGDRSLSPSLGYTFYFKESNNLKIGSGIIISHFSNTFVIENRWIRSIDVHEFFRFIFPLEFNYSLKGFNTGAMILWTYNLKSINNYGYEWLEESFNRFGIGVSLSLEKQISSHFIFGIYYKFYPTPLYSNDLHSFREQGYGLTLSYQFIKKTGESDIN